MFDRTDNRLRSPLKRANCSSGTGLMLGLGVGLGLDADSN